MISSAVLGVGYPACMCMCKNPNEKQPREDVRTNDNKEDVDGILPRTIDEAEPVSFTSGSGTTRGVSSAFSAGPPPNEEDDYMRSWKLESELAEERDNRKRFEVALTEERRLRQHMEMELGARMDKLDRQFVMVKQHASDANAVATPLFSSADICDQYESLVPVAPSMAVEDGIQDDFVERAEAVERDMWGRPLALTSAARVGGAPHFGHSAVDQAIVEGGSATSSCSGFGGAGVDDMRRDSVTSDSGVPIADEIALCGGENERDSGTSDSEVASSSEAVAGDFRTEIAGSEGTVVEVVSAEIPQTLSRCKSLAQLRCLPKTDELGLNSGRRGPVVLLPEAALNDFKGFDVSLGNQTAQERPIEIERFESFVEESGPWHEAGTMDPDEPELGPIVAGRLSDLLEERMARLETLVDGRIPGLAEVTTEGGGGGTIPRAVQSPPPQVERGLRNLLTSSAASPLSSHDLAHSSTEKPFTKDSLALHTVLAPLQDKLDRTFLNACSPTAEEVRVSSGGCADASIGPGAGLEGSVGASPNDVSKDGGGTGGGQGGTFRDGSTGGATEDSSAQPSEDCIKAELGQAAAGGEGGSGGTADAMGKSARYAGAAGGLPPPLLPAPAAAAAVSLRPPSTTVKRVRGLAYPGAAAGCGGALATAAAALLPLSCCCRVVERIGAR